jgi:hypothetical protein
MPNQADSFPAKVCRHELSPVLKNKILYFKYSGLSGLCVLRLGNTDT